MKKEVSVFKVICWFLLSLILFFILNIIAYYFYNWLIDVLSNISFVKKLLSYPIIYILTILSITFTIGKYVSTVIAVMLPKYSINVCKAYYGVGIILIIVNITSFIIYINQSHMNFDISYIIGGIYIIMMAKGLMFNINDNS